jgi:hypothetical protein
MQISHVSNPLDLAAGLRDQPRHVQMYSMPRFARFDRPVSQVTGGLVRIMSVARTVPAWVPINLTGQGAVPLPPAEAIAQLEDRLQELRDLAEEEGTKYSNAAEQDLRQFLNDAGASARPALYLQDEGWLRAKWRNLQGEQVGLLFIGGGRVQMVFFVHRRNGEMARLAGQDTLEGALCQVRSLRLQPLLKS